MLKVDIVPRVDEIAWNEHVRTSLGGSLFQTSHWAEYMRDYLGARPMYLLARQDGHLVAQLLLFESQRGRESVPPRVGAVVGRMAVSLLRIFTWRSGPLIFAERGRDALLAACLDAVERMAMRCGATGIEEAYLPVETDEASDAMVFRARGYDVETRATIRIDLRHPLHQIWSRLKQGSARTPVRKGTRQGLVFEQALDVAAFYELVRIWRRDQGFVPYPREKFEKMLVHLKPYCSFFLARHGGDPVGGIGVWHFRGQAQLFTPVQSDTARASGIPISDFLYWNLIEWCHRSGMETLDLSGIALTQGSAKEAGIRKFKEKWGGEIVQYAAYQQVFKPVRWGLVNAVQAVKRRLRAAAGPVGHPAAAQRSLAAE